MAKLADVVEQLKTNNQTNVDINAGIAGLENMFGKYFADQARVGLEDRRESGKTTTKAKTAKAGGTTNKSLLNLGGFGGLGGILAGAGVGIGAAGAGIGAFFVGLAGAEAIMQKFGSGDNLKKLLTNLGQGLEAFSEKGFKALGTVLLGGALFGTIGRGTAAGAGIALVGGGIAAFFTALAASDKAMEMMNSGGGENLAKFLTNFGTALSALDNDGMIRLGGLMAAGGALAALFGVGTAARAAAGITLIGAGIAGFFGALGLGDKLTQLLNVDGSGIATIMKNVAEGLNAFEPDSLKALGAFMGTGAALGLFGPIFPGLAAIGMTLIGSGVAGFLGAMAGAGDKFNKMGVKGDGLKVIMKNIAEGLNEFNKVDANIGKKVKAVATLGPSLLLLFGSQGLASVADSIVGKTKEAINFLFGTNLETDQNKARKSQIAAIVDSLTPLKDLDSSVVDRLGLIGNAIKNFADSFKILGEIQIDRFKRDLNSLAKSLGGTYKLLEVMANGGKIGEGYFDGIREVDFGPKGSGGILNPDLKLDQLVEKIEQANFVLGRTTVRPGSQEPKTLTAGAGLTGGTAVARDGGNPGGVSYTDLSSKDTNNFQTAVISGGPIINTQDQFAGRLPGD